METHKTRTLGDERKKARRQRKLKKKGKRRSDYISKINDPEYSPETQTPFFYDLRHLLRLEQQGTNNSKFAGKRLWGHAIFWLGFAGYTVLAVSEWLNFVDIEYDNPLFYAIFHGALAIYFFVVFLNVSYRFAREALLGEEMTSAVRACAGTVFNSISGITLLIWIVLNTEFWDGTDFTDDPDQTVSYRDIISLSFVLYILFVVIVVVCYMVRYTQQKLVEIQSKAIRHIGANTTGSTLKELLVKSEQFLDKKSCSFTANNSDV